MQEKANFLQKVMPDKYNEKIIRGMTPHQISQAYEKLMKHGPGSFKEGYPDTHIEHGEDNTHTARISDRTWDANMNRHAKGPTPPGTNMDFVQARDVSIEKVSERADADMDALFGRIMTRSGLSEDDQIPDQTEIVSPHRKPGVRETAIPRARVRWV